MYSTLLFGSIQYGVLDADNGPRAAAQILSEVVLRQNTWEGWGPSSYNIHDPVLYTIQNPKGQTKLLRALGQQAPLARRLYAEPTGLQPGPRPTDPMERLKGAKAQRCKGPRIKKPSDPAGAKDGCPTLCLAC